MNECQTQIKSECIQNIWLTYVPISHNDPVHSEGQVQVSTPVQLPPFWQGLVHTAERIGKRDTNNDQLHANSAQ